VTEAWVLEAVEEVDRPPARRPGVPSGRVGTGGRMRRAPVAEGEALPREVVEELAAAAGSAAPRLAQRLAVAAGAYERDRYHDTLRITRQLLAQVPGSPSVHELHGLACYRLGRWREALKHLEAAGTLGGDDTAQWPVRMDCSRALGRMQEVEELWEQLRAASPDADVLVEGRLVLAAARADSGNLQGAIDLLVGSGASRDLRHPAERHVRQWYVLADLCERAGDLPRARDLFARVVRADPQLADAAERLAALGPPRSRGRRGAGRTQRHAAQ